MRRPAGGLALVALVVAPGCIDQEFSERPFDSIAVTAGDFDNVELSLDRLEIAYQLYEGFISAAAYDPELDPDLIAQDVEYLFGGQTDGASVLLEHDALFVNSGTRGLGEYVYNGVDPDDSLIADPAVIEAVTEYVEDRGRVLVVTDWAYELIEACWPDAIDFYGEDGELDAAQVGHAGRISTTVSSEDLQGAFPEQPTLSLDFDYSNWSLMEGVGPDTTVHLSAESVDYRISESEGDGTLNAVPVLVTFQPADGGLVVYSSFHFGAQSAAITDEILLSLVSGLDPGNAEDASADEDTASSDEGVSE